MLWNSSLVPFSSTFENTSSGRLDEYRLDIIAMVAACTFILFRPIELRTSLSSWASQINRSVSSLFTDRNGEWLCSRSKVGSRGSALSGPVCSFLSFFATKPLASLGFYANYGNVSSGNYHRSDVCERWLCCENQVVLEPTGRQQHSVFYTEGVISC